jgi:hypothetical protein
VIIGVVFPLPRNMFIIFSSLLRRRDRRGSFPAAAQHVLIFVVFALQAWSSGWFSRSRATCFNVCRLCCAGVIIGVVMVQVLVVALGLLLSYCLAKRIQAGHDI